MSSLTMERFHYIKIHNILMCRALRAFELEELTLLKNPLETDYFKAWIILSEENIFYLRAVDF